MIMPHFALYEFLFFKLVGSVFYQNVKPTAEFNMTKVFSFVGYDIHPCFCFLRNDTMNTGLYAIFLDQPFQSLIHGTDHFFR